jgi:hypothetical protein
VSHVCMRVRRLSARLGRIGCAAATVEDVPYDLHCPRCGATRQEPNVACPDCAEEQECRHLRERLFGSNPQLTLRTE